MRIVKIISRLAIILCLLLLAMSLLADTVEAPQMTAERIDRNIWIIPIQGDIMPSMAAFVRREARRAVNNGAEYIIFEIDTFGGRVDSTLQITSFITSLRDVRTIAWITSGEYAMGVSWSAGALIAFACDEIFMAPGTSMGAAAPVIGGDAAGEKNVAAVRSQIAALAERNGHPVGLALAMVDFDIELWEVIVYGQTRALTIGEIERLERTGTQVERIAVISEPGKLLSLTPGEAYRYGLLAGVVEGREELFSSLGIAGEVTESFPSAADGVVSFFTSGPVQALLILIALVMLFLEFQSPGFGIPGGVALVAFIVVFGSSALLGRVGSVEIILFVLGLALLAVEIFVLPGFGVMGIAGILIVGISLVLSMQDFVVPQFEWEREMFGRNVAVVLVSIVGSILSIAVLALLGPKIRMFDRLTLKTAITGTSGGPDPDITVGKNIEAAKVVAAEDEDDFAALVGKRGVTDSTLRPSGKATIDDKSYVVETDGEFVEAGRGVLVTRVRGNRITVKRV